MGEWLPGARGAELLFKGCGLSPWGDGNVLEPGRWLHRFVTGLSISELYI